MDDDTREDLRLDAIEGEPVYTLEECVAVSRFTDDDGGNDTADVPDTIAELKEGFANCVFLCDEEMLAFLRLAAALSEKKESWDTDVTMYPFNVFYFSRYAYLFLRDDKYYLVLPKELIEIFREVTARDDFTAINARKLEMKSYAIALLELYGAYEIGQYVKVWNHHHRDKITLEEAKRFLSDLEDISPDYCLDDDGLVVYNCLNWEELDELLEDTLNIAYYMPSKSVIQECVNKRYDYSYKIPGEKEMDAFLAGYIKDEFHLDIVQIKIGDACLCLKDPDEVYEILADTGAPLDDAEFVERFERLFTNLRSHSHCWALRGHTPYQYQIETGEEIPFFRLPRKKKRMKRNR